MPRIANYVLPCLVLLLAFAGWEALVRVNEIPPYILPAPSRVFTTLVQDWPILYGSLVNTLQITFGALAIAVIGGVGLAVLFTQSKWVELSLFPAGSGYNGSRAPLVLGVGALIGMIRCLSTMATMKNVARLTSHVK